MKSQRRGLPERESTTTKREVAKKLLNHNSPYEDYIPPVFSVRNRSSKSRLTAPLDHRHRTSVPNLSKNILKSKIGEPSPEKIRFANSALNLLIEDSDTDLSAYEDLDTLPKIKGAFPSPKQSQSELFTQSFTNSNWT